MEEEDTGVGAEEEQLQEKRRGAGQKRQKSGGGAGSKGGQEHTMVCSISHMVVMDFRLHRLAEFPERNTS